MWIFLMTRQAVACPRGYASQIAIPEELVRIPAESDQHSCLKAITIPV
jgi:hypothetical protein